jgi:hypothetical protein
MRYMLCAICRALALALALALASRLALALGAWRLGLGLGAWRPSCFALLPASCFLPNFPLVLLPWSWWLVGFGGLGVWEWQYVVRNTKAAKRQSQARLLGKRQDGALPARGPGAR